MIGFDFVDGDVSRQRTVFADGTSVSVNLREGTYRIDLAE